MSAWKEAKTSDGRTYYYNTQTKETSWTLPSAIQLSHSNSSNPPEPPSLSASSSANDTIDEELPPSYASLPGSSEEKERFEALEKRVSAAIQREQLMNKQLHQLLSKMESVSGILSKH